MYTRFYLFHNPIIDITIGLDSGKTKLDCNSCSEDYTDHESGKKLGIMLEKQASGFMMRKNEKV
jgi:hypothetical protein